MSPGTTEISYTDQSVTFSGTVSGLWPDGTVQPRADKMMMLYNPVGSPTPVTTGSGGSFELTFKPLPLGVYYLELPASSRSPRNR